MKTSRILLSASRKKSTVTYQQFVTHATTAYTQQALNSSAWTGTYYLKYDTVVGSMWGSPIGDYFTTDSGSSRVIQHCLPTALYSEYFSSGRLVIMNRVASGTSASFRSQNINGYLSSTYGSYAAHSVTTFIYWDSTRQLAMSYNPFTMSTPVEYRFT